MHQMHRNLPHLVRAILGLAGGMALLVTVSCDRDLPLATGPAVRATAQIAAADSQPFYLYQGQKILLEVDPTQLLVEDSVSAMGRPTSNQTAEAATRVGQVARIVLGPLGIQITGPDLLPQARGHWVLHLPVGTTRATALAAHARLKADRRFRFAAPAYKLAGSGGRYWLTNRVGVQFRIGVTRLQVDSLAAALRLTIIRAPRPDSGFTAYWMRYPSDSAADPLTIAAQLNGNPLVQWAEADNITDGAKHFTPTDPYYALEFYLKNSNTSFGIAVDDNVEAAWDLNKGGGIPSAGGMRIAVLDDGVQASHPDFGGHIQFGYDVWPNADNTLGCTDCAWNPAGNYSHGTLVSGVILGQHDGSGMVGIAPDALVFPIRIFHGDQLAAALDVASGIDFAWNFLGAQILSNSWGVS